MKQFNTKAIVLSRLDYGEADRIVNVLTPNEGKLTLMARGVRKIKSKLAGGIELFSISDITYIKGKGSIDTLTSSRLDQHFGNITKNIEKVQLGYDLIKSVNKQTEDHPGTEYFDLLATVFKALNVESNSESVIKVWFDAQLIYLSGHGPNLYQDQTGEPLQADKRYNFDIDGMYFVDSSKGRYRANDIKCLRLIFSNHHLENILKIKDLELLISRIDPLVTTLLSNV